MPTDPNEKLRPDAERLAEIFTNLQRCFVLKLSKGLSESQISVPQYLLLGSLAQHASPLTMTEIAKRMNHTTAAATGLVDRLEKLDFARRETGTKDRRKVFVQLTAKGSDLVARVRRDMATNLVGLMNLLDEEEQGMWLRIYNKIYPHCMES